MEYLSESEILEMVRESSSRFTQQEMAERLGVSQQSVSKMLQGHSSMLSLAVRWIEMNPSVSIAIESDDGKPVLYYRIKK